MAEIIAIDGPASVGKSTLAKIISNYYNSPVLNSGKLYRAVALEIQKKDIDINDKEMIIKIANIILHIYQMVNQNVLLILIIVALILIVFLQKM